MTGSRRDWCCAEVPWRQQKPTSQVTCEPPSWWHQLERQLGRGVAAETSSGLLSSGHLRAPSVLMQPLVPPQFPAPLFTAFLFLCGSSTSTCSTACVAQVHSLNAVGIQNPENAWRVPLLLPHTSPFILLSPLRVPAGLPAYVQIKSTFPGKQTDITPSTFWMAGAANNFIGNVAAGSEDSG